MKQRRSLDSDVHPDSGSSVGDAVVENSDPVFYLDVLIRSRLQASCDHPDV